jgi:membrane protein required for colicin V production
MGEHARMNLVDVIVLVVVAFSGLMGFLRGMVREVLGLSAWVGAGLAAWWFFPKLQPIAHREIANADIADPVAFGGTFLLVLIVLSLLARSLGMVVRRSALGGLDRTLGLVYGLARGAAIMVFAYIMAGTVEPVDRWPDAVLEARVLPSIYLGAVWVADRLPVPENYRPVVAAPPAGRTATSAELLHANPVGRALGAPPSRQ